MQLSNTTAVITGGASGLGEATVRLFAARGARVAILDRNVEAGQRLVAELGGEDHAFFAACDVSDGTAAQAALDAAQAALGAPGILVNCAGIGTAKRILAKDGSPAPLEDFSRVVQINLVGSYNMARLVAARMARNAPGADGERGVIIQTASVAAYDGQIGQEAYSASKGGIVGMTLPMARDLAQFGIRVVTIAPGLFLTPLMHTLPEAVQQSLAQSIPFPKRLGKPEEYAGLAAHVVGNLSLNGETIRLDGALRLAPY